MINHQVQRILINFGNTEASIITKTEGCVTFTSNGNRDGEPRTLHGVIIGVDGFGMNLSFLRDGTSTPILIPLGYITAVDQQLDDGEEIINGGPNGNFFVRAGKPTDLIGTDGGIWFDTNSPNNVYYKQNGHWTLRCSLKGEQGIQGVPGKNAHDILGTEVFPILRINQVYYDKDFMFRMCNTPDFKPGTFVALYYPEERLAKVFFYTGYTHTEPHLSEFDHSGLMYVCDINGKNAMYIMGQPGKDGDTPYIDQVTNHWMIAGNDLGVEAVGKQGPRGFDGSPGKDGAQGERGYMGPVGPQGKQGDSLYYHSTYKQFMVGTTNMTDQLTELINDVIDYRLAKIYSVKKRLLDGDNPTD